ncbi:MAG TPA: methyltransferase domain-containing protein [Candidatus Obscuribacterales bacterium]
MDIQQTFARLLVDPLHKRLLSDRHTRQLMQAAAEFLPAEEALSGLDIGCGSGKKAQYLQQLRPRLQLTGVDVLVRPDAVIPVTAYDGLTLPFSDNSFDFSMLIDVIHHADDQQRLLQESARISRRFVIVKDHVCESQADQALLSLMDWVGNRAHGIRLPNKYLSDSQWLELYANSSLEISRCNRSLSLYMPLLSPIFDGKLHFLALLQPAAAVSRSA